MKKTYLMMLALASMLCLGFSSRSSDDDDDSSTTETLSTKIGNAVGTYKETDVMYLLDSDGKLNDIDAVMKSYNSDAETINDGAVSTVYVTKEGTSNLSITDSEDSSDILRCTKLANTSNGFTFDISSQTVDGVTVEGYNGWSLTGVKYNGGYLTASKTLCYYQKVSIADWASKTDDADVKTFLTQLEDSYSALVVKSTLVKK